MSITFSAWVSLEVSRLFPASSLSICFFLLCVICHHLPLMFSEILPSLSPPLPSFHSETLSLAQPFCNSTLPAPQSPSGGLPSILISFKPPLWWCSKCTTLFKHAGFATYLCRFSARTAAHMVANSANWRAYPNICPHSCFTASISQFLCLECYSSRLILKRQFKFLCSCHSLCKVWADCSNEDSTSLSCSTRVRLIFTFSSIKAHSLCILVLFSYFDFLIV